MTKRATSDDSAQFVDEMYESTLKKVDDQDLNDQEVVLELIKNSKLKNTLNSGRNVQKRSRIQIKLHYFLKTE